jgi:hypothetical protein
VKRAALAAAGLLSLAVSCKRPQPPKIEEVWLGPTSGCVQVKGGTVQCFGELPWGQKLTEPTRVDDLGVSGEKLQMALGTKQACFSDGTIVHCRGERTVAVRDTDARVLSIGRDQTCMIHVLKRPEAPLPITVSCIDALKNVAPSPPDLAGRELGLESDPHPKTLAVGDTFTCVGSVRGAPPKETPVDVRCNGTMEKTPLLQGEAIRSLAAGGSGHVCAVKAGDGSVWCWGRNDTGQLGDASTSDATKPVAAIGVAGAAEVALGARHSCALLGSGTVTCWGANDHHQLANGTTEKSVRPIPVHGLLGVRKLVAAGDATCARLGDGDVRCWGKNDRYQLGDGTTVEHVVPAPIKLRPEPR